MELVEEVKQYVQPLEMEKNYPKFWEWFEQNEAEFYLAYSKKGSDISNFMEKLTAKFDELEFPFICWFFLDEKKSGTDKISLTFTVNGCVKAFFMVEEFVNLAPDFNNWLIDAHCKPMDNYNFRISGNGYNFDDSNLYFYSLPHPDLPDFINLRVIYDDYKKEDHQHILGGISAYLKKVLGELNTNTIDSLILIPKEEAELELVPINKLQAFLIWRASEFIEKYDNVVYKVDRSTDVQFEADNEFGHPVKAVMNRGLLNWDQKCSHPWLLTISVDYETIHENGLPDIKAQNILVNVDKAIGEKLKDKDGYLYVGKQITNNNVRIYIMCKEYAYSSKTIYRLTEQFKNEVHINHDVTKDKYLQTLRNYNVY